MTQQLQGMLERLKAGSGSIAKEAPRMIAFVAKQTDVRILTECRAQASAVADYLAHRQAASVEEFNIALKVKAHVEHRLGEVLKAIVNHNGSRGAGPGRGKKTGNTVLPVSATIPEGITKMQSSRLQQLAAIPLDRIDAAIDASTDAQKKARLGKIVNECRHEQLRVYRPETCAASELQELVSSGQRFRCIYADPPWQYRNTASNGPAHKRYATMPLEEIVALPVAELAAPQAHLWLWATNAFHIEALTQVMPAWGFEFKAIYVWCKHRIGMGNYLRNAHELLLLGVRGQLRGCATDVPSWGRFKRVGHSVKPEQIRRDVIECVSPGPYLELFGRSIVDGWVVWGNEIDRGAFDGDTKKAA